MRLDVLTERFFTALISGDRGGARRIIDEVLDARGTAEKIYDRLFWPTLEHMQRLYRADQMTAIAHHYATRLMRMLVDQMQLRLETQDTRGKRVLVACGPEESEELGGQMVTDLLEADGYEVFFIGGGVANDEIVSQVGELDTDALVIFGATPSTVPFTRLLIDRLHSIGVCPKLQIVVGGGVFNRADGLAEEIGADLWAKSPSELVGMMSDSPKRRMSPDQRTVGRKRRAGRGSAAAA